MMRLRAPFPWFGGKSRVAHIVWDYFGNPPNYIEPFYGSGAILLGRPHSPKTETINDKDCYVANFWRAVQADPELVAVYCDHPVNEADLHARHQWLVNQSEFRERMMSDPLFYDPQVAGWWCWGISQWIGSGWCSRPEWTGRAAKSKPRGIHTNYYRQRPSLTRVRDISMSNAWRKQPAMRRGSPGVLRKEFELPLKRIGLTNRSGLMRQLLNGRSLTIHQMPQLGGDGSGNGREVLSQTIRENLIGYMMQLADRLRSVRVCCGNWNRICGPSPTTGIGLTAVFMDPPYSGEADRDPSIYNAEDLLVAREAAAWCIANGDNPKLRIALCGYEGEHKMPASWTCISWKANGGYGNQSNGNGRKNADRERIWFSPHCLKPGILPVKGGHA